MARMRFALILLLGMSLAGCGTTSSVNTTTGELRSQPSVTVPQQNTEVSAETLATGAAIAAFGLPAAITGTASNPVIGTAPLQYSAVNAALLYIIYDPLAPNWTIKERVLSADTYHLSMTAKSFRTGGDGEAIQIVKRRALQLQRDRGYADYRILDYTEGIESSTPFTHRVSQGTIQLVRAKAPERR